MLGSFTQQVSWWVLTICVGSQIGFQRVFLCTAGGWCRVTLFWLFQSLGPLQWHALQGALPGLSEQHPPELDCQCAQSGGLSDVTRVWLIRYERYFELISSEQLKHFFISFIECSETAVGEPLERACAFKWMYQVALLRACPFVVTLPSSSMSVTEAKIKVGISLSLLDYNSLQGWFMKWMTLSIKVAALAKFGMQETSILMLMQ